MAWTLPDTAAAGDAGHVTDHNLILTALSSMNGAWTSYTPTVTQGAGSIVYGTRYGYYLRLSNFVVGYYNIYMAATTAGSSGSVIEINIGMLPTPVRPDANLVAGLGYALDSGTTTYSGTLNFYSSSSWGINTNSWVGGGFGLAVNDQITGLFAYEVA